MDARQAIGRFIRTRREARQWTQQQLAKKIGITYQYLSAVENGKENPTLDVLEMTCKAFGVSLPRFVIEAFYGLSSHNPPPLVDRKFFRADVPLPPLLTREHIAEAMDETQRLIHIINSSLISMGADPLTKYIQGNNFSGIVSNLLTDSFSRCSPYRRNNHARYPDLIAEVSDREQCGLEIKSTIKVGKGGESHNGHSGWHIVACFTPDDITGDIEFKHVMVADLNGHNHKNPDWKYSKSQVNVETGSQRTETYITTASGNAKLRHGSIFLHESIGTSKWRMPNGTIPSHSIYFARSQQKPRK